MLAWGCRRSNPGGGLAPLSTPPLFRAGGCALILYNFESKMQSVALSRYEKMCVLHARKKLSHLQLGSQSDEYGWLVMHSLYHLGPVLVPLTREPSTLRRRVSDTGSKVIQQTGLDSEIKGRYVVLYRPR